MGISLGFRLGHISDYTVNSPNSSPRSNLTRQCLSVNLFIMEIANREKLACSRSFRYGLSRFKKNE